MLFPDSSLHSCICLWDKPFYFSVSEWENNSEHQYACMSESHSHSTNPFLEKLWLRQLKTLPETQYSVTENVTSLKLAGFVSKRASIKRFYFCNIGDDSFITELIVRGLRIQFIFSLQVLLQWIKYLQKKIYSVKDRLNTAKVC